jgi:hypothetical protein
MIKIQQVERRQDGAVIPERSEPMEYYDKANTRWVSIDAVVANALHLATAKNKGSRRLVAILGCLIFEASPCHGIVTKPPAASILCSLSII